MVRGIFRGPIFRWPVYHSRTLDRMNAQRALQQHTELPLNSLILSISKTRDMQTSIGRLKYMLPVSFDR